MATQSDVNQAGPDDVAESEIEDDVTEDDDSQELDEDEAGGLVAIANLDLEAAMVYELVADSVEETDLKEMLRSFAKDHRRHVAELDNIVREMGGEIADDADRVGGLLLGLASTLGALDEDAAVEALIANEQLTNGTYSTALWAISLPSAEEVIKQNAADEQRHLKALLDYQRKR